MLAAANAVDRLPGWLGLPAAAAAAVGVAVGA